MSASNNILLSTAYFPPVSWIKAVVDADTVFIEAHETYPKQTYRNRCRIITANGVLPLSIPVSKPEGRHSKTKDIEILYVEAWQRMHKRSIDAAYSNSPFYLYYKDDLERFFENKFRFLLDFNMEIQHTLMGLLGITTEMHLTECYDHEPMEMQDLRNAFSPKTKDNSQKSPPYHQVFEERFGFVADLSILDLLFNEGPLAVDSLRLTVGGY